MINRPPRILMINDHIHFGGGGDAVFRLERDAYEQAGYDVYTFSHAKNSLKDFSEKDYICVDRGGHIGVKVGKFLGAPYVKKSLRKVLTDVQPDLVRLHLISKYPAEIYSAIKGYKVIQTLHGPNLFCANSWGNLKKNGLQCELGIGMKCWSRGCVPFSTALLYTTLDKRLTPNVKQSVQLFHCPSMQIKDKADSLGYTPTIYIPLGVDKAFIEAKPAVHDGPPIVLYVGGLIEEKGVLFLPEMLQRIAEQIPNVKLKICGRGPLLDRLASDFNSKGLSDNVEFMGFVDRSKIVQLYRTAHVFVCPSIYAEQFGLVGPEALACGVPCVGSAVGGIPEWLHDEKWGYLVEPRNSSILADRVISLLLDRNKRLLFGQRGRDYVLAKHNPRDYQSFWLDVADRFITV